MKSAFLFVGIFPPPATGPGVIARSDRTRARRAANAGESFAMQAVDGNVVCVNIFFYGQFIPIKKRIHFNQGMIRVPLRDRDAGPVGRLAAPEPRNPRFASLECAL